MLAAEELNMIDSGEYVFFNIEIFGSMTATTIKPWYNASDTEERNMLAKKAYSGKLATVVMV
jgi:atrial natriuretic peptide receptor A